MRPIGTVTSTWMMNVWTHISNGMYGSFVVTADDTPAASYSVQFADMYISAAQVSHEEDDDDDDDDDSNGKSTTSTIGFDFGAFMDEDNTLEVTNGQAFNYAPFIGSDR